MKLNTIRVKPRAVALLAMSLVLAGCGGGSASSGPTLQLSQTQVHQDSNTSDLAATVTINAVLQNPPATYYYQTSRQGGALSAVQANFPTSSRGDLVLTFWRAAILGAGTYQDTATLTICSDSKCANPVATASVKVTYVVTGNSEPDTTFLLSPQSSTNFQVQSSAAAGPTVSLLLDITDAPPYEIYVQFVQRPASGSPDLLASAAWQSTPNSASGTIVATLKSPAAVGGVGVYGEQLLVSLCFDQACTRTAAGSPLTIPVTYTVLATSGTDYSQQVLSLNAGNVIFDPHSGKLYITQIAQSGNSVARVDPATGTVETTAPLSFQPSQLAVSDDGQFLYVGAQYTQTIQRFLLPALTPDITITLNGVLNPAYIAVAPGAAHTIAVALAQNLIGAGVIVYDDATPRPDSAPAPVSPDESVDAISWGADATTLYVLDAYQQELYTYQVDASGLSLAHTAASTLGGQIQYVNGLLYDVYNGTIFNPATNTVTGQLPAAGPTAVNVALNRAFVMLSSPLAIESVNLSSLDEIGLTTFPTLTSSGRPPVLWGGNGLAFVAYYGQLVILSGNFIGP